MAIKYEEFQEMANAINPVIAALALRAATYGVELETQFTGKEFQDKYNTEFERIYEGLKAYLAGDEDAVESPEMSELDALLAVLEAGSGEVDPLDLSL